MKKARAQFRLVYIASHTLLSTFHAFTPIIPVAVRSVASSGCTMPNFSARTSHEQPPYLYGAQEQGYGEINSLGPNTAVLIHREVLRIFGEL